MFECGPAKAERSAPRRDVTNLATLSTKLATAATVTVWDVHSQLTTV